jgi:PAS domain S-box-containing protein
LAKNNKNQPDFSGILFDELFDLSEDLIFLLDPDGNFIKINRSGALNLEYDPAELKGRHFFSIISKQSYRTFSANLAELFSGSSPVKFDAVLISRLGISMEYCLRIKTVYEKDILVGAAGIAKNISSLVRSREKQLELESKLTESSRMISIERARWKQDNSILEELNKLKAEFISNISHELRTPLASIIGFSETILSDPEMSEELRDEFNNIILTEGKRLAKLINEILELSTMEPGKVLLELTETGLKKILKEAIDANSFSVIEKDINFTFELPEEEVIIKGDKTKLFVVFDNLIRNAVNSTNQGGRVKLILHKINGEAEVIISDTGAGISEKNLSLIFNKVNNKANPSHSGVSGINIDLVFIKQIIDLHRGLIVVHSEENKGTTFVIKFPYHNKFEGSP